MSRDSVAAVARNARRKRISTRGKLLLALVLLVPVLLVAIAPYLILIRYVDPNPSPHPVRAAYHWFEYNPGSLFRLRPTLGYDVDVQRWEENDSDFHRTHSFRENAQISTQWMLKTMGVAKANAESELASKNPSIPVIQKSARFLIEFEHLDEARAILTRAIQKLHPGAGIDYRNAPDLLLARLGESYLREAETKNLQSPHPCETYLFPHEGGCVHADKRPARHALELFRVLASRDPDQLRFRWLGALAARSIGVDPDSEGVGLPRPILGFGPFPKMIDVADRVGLVARRAAGGVVMEDFNGDGFLDVLMGSCLAEDPLLYFQNRGDGTFSEVSEWGGVGNILNAFRLKQMDYDNDGYLDLMVTPDGMTRAGRKTLLRNDGSGRFQDVTRAAGLDHPNERTAASAWADYDNDGWVDFFAVNNGREETSRLYRNRGDGTFEDVTKAARFPSLAEAQGAAWGDYDNDGDQDLYVSIFSGPNHLLRNNGNGTFSDVTFEAGVPCPYVSFGPYFCDYDNDGNLDLYVTGYWPVVEEEVGHLLGIRKVDGATTARLYRNRGDGTFEDVTRPTGLEVPLSTMGANYGDLDSDGYLDFYFGTGAPTLGSLVPNRLFHNLGGRRFEDVTFSAKVGHVQKGHGIAFGDFDRDGDVDLLVSMGGDCPADRFKPALFQNPGNGNYWIEVRLVGTTSNRAAIGARICAVLPDGRRVYRTIASGGPFGSSPLQQHLGLGQSDRVDRLEVKWPSGIQETIRDVRADRYLVLAEGRGEVESRLSLESEEPPGAR